MAEFINADHDEIMLGPSTTMHVYMMAQALRPQFKAGDEIIVTEQDHEANVGAWRRLEEFGIVIREWQVDRETGALRYEMLDQLLSPRTRLVAFTHCSNVASIVHDVPALVKKIHAAGRPRLRRRDRLRAALPGRRQGAGLRLLRLQPLQGVRAASVGAVRQARAS